VAKFATLKAYKNKATWSFGKRFASFEPVQRTL
jgi:hypothetical protein